MRRFGGTSVRIHAVQPTTLEWYRDPAEPVPFRHRLMWSPITALVCFAGMIAADLVLGMTLARMAGLAIGALWLGLAIHNRRTNGAFLRDLYTPDDVAPSARVVEHVAEAHVVEPPHGQKP